jgi:ADP-heptose:LPS heptosyltransferase
MSRPIRSVLVLTKHRFMGDTIVAVPLLRAARRAYPDARVTLVTGAQAAVVLQNCPYTDRILAHDAKAAARTAAGSAHLSALLVRQMAGLFWTDRPDLCLVADRSFRAAVAAVLAGGRIRAGFDTEGRGRLLTHPVPYDPDRHEAECCLDILRVVAPEVPGEPRYDPRAELWVTGAERARGAEILAEYGVACSPEGHVPLVGVQPGASHDYKQWAPERFAEVAQTLAEECGATIVLLGAGDAEIEASRRMREAMSADVPVIDLTGKTRLRETMGLLPHLSLFVGNDTGPNHIAAGLGVPTVALFGPTPAHKWGNRGPANRVLVAPDGDMGRLAVEPVREAALSLLGAVGAPPPAAASAAPEDDLAVGAKR